MCHEYKLIWLVSAGAASYYAASMVKFKFIWFTDENVYCISTKQHHE